ncbi:DUF475 domain-containing protein [Candidatus Liberibacter sp.]|uniref:DUF475 domain-containing protein n=1 Tax=Candidatus Liberibacter sp. TaxID=34022 RepID=UPI0015F546DD|nr:DUF475 domain-containing protein [Candidatus Liberibacter sp.]MBA5723983.1 DUF475 domain-containing protein [Candidatus Liberibacter sp.]
MKNDIPYKNSLSHFRWAFATTAVGILLSILIGWQTTGTLYGTSKVLYICIVLAILEISLSFDNAILNAKSLQKMSPLWQNRFLTWGILIAVFGMRVIFPILIVSISAKINPIEAINIAIFHPQDYLKIITEAHLSITGFGGTFLIMVSLAFFLDTKKNIHWIRFLEIPMNFLARIKGSKIFIVLLIVSAISCALPAKDLHVLIVSSILALIAFYAMSFLENILSNGSQKNIIRHAKSGFSTFLYLEIIDASLSFDGVISAFALTKNFFIIIIGLTIGAVYIRSMTLLVLKKGILGKYRYLEHGAFYAILMLSVVMFLQTVSNIPEIFTGTCSAILIILSIYSSIIYNRSRKNISES